jgi:hypothetical protein
MGFITFIYKVENDPKTYYGKYCFDYISDDHDGLDNEVKYNLKQMLLYLYRKQNNIQEIKPKVMIGILSFSRDDVVPTHSTKNEIKCFDFYKYYDEDIYINGKKWNETTQHLEDEKLEEEEEEVEDEEEEVEDDEEEEDDVELLSVFVKRMICTPKK